MKCVCRQIYQRDTKHTTFIAPLTECPLTALDLILRLQILAEFGQGFPGKSRSEGTQGMKGQGARAGF
eukprot:6168599-Pleurochrysis_carterae.AAC.1